MIFHYPFDKRGADVERPECIDLTTLNEYVDDMEAWVEAYIAGKAP